MFNRTLSYFVLILTMSGCQSTQFPTGTASLPASADAARMEQRATAMREGSQRTALLISAAEAYLDEGQPEQTLRVIDLLRAGTVSTAQATRVARVESRAWLQTGQLHKARQALAFVARLQPDDLLLLGEICAGLEDHRCAADAYIQASIELGMGAPGLPADIHDRIWAELSQASKAPPVFSHRYHQAWWSLQQNLRQAGSVSARIKQWQLWQQDNPSHPARLAPPTALQQLGSYQLPRIGVLLPLSGSLASAGAAVRDGMVAAVLDEYSQQQSPVRFYDTAATPLGELYEKALNDGMDVLVGPLLKSNAEAFAELTAYERIPRLLLNYLPDEQALEEAGPSNLFQIGIAIEDEVASLADFMLGQGHSKVAVLYSHAGWSERARHAYAKQWPHPAIHSGFADIKGVTAAVGEAMQVAASEGRRDEIANLLGQLLEFQPRARSDLDAVVALTTNVEAQALVPALRYHFADNLPVYATSQVARGNNLQALQGFAVTEIPLLADPANKAQAMVEAFNLSGGTLAELYALGYDAYAISTWLPLLQQTAHLQFTGASGDLYLADGGRFHRLLPVSRITDSGQIRQVD